MSSYSDFQLKHPLSKKKYLKKMINTCVASLFALLVLGVILRLLTTDGSFNYLNFLLFSLVTFIVIALLYSWYVKNYISSYYYNCDDKFTAIKKGVFTPVEIHVLYQKIQDVYVDQDIVDRLLGICDVHIASATASSAIEAHIDGLDKEIAESARDFLLAKINGRSASSMTRNVSEAEVSIKYSKKELISSKNYSISNFLLITSSLTGFFYGFIFPIAFINKVLDSKDNLPILIYCGVGGAIINSIFTAIWKSLYYFELAEDGILLKTGVISRSARHLPYRSIQDISVSQGVLDRFLGLYKVSIQDATSNSSLVIPGQTKSNAEKISSILNGIIGKKSNPSSMGL